MRLEEVERTHSLENGEDIFLDSFQHLSAYSTNSKVANYNSNCIVVVVVVVEEEESCRWWRENKHGYGNGLKMEEEVAADAAADGDDLQGQVNGRYMEKDVSEVVDAAVVASRFEYLFLYDPPLQH